MSSQPQIPVEEIDLIPHPLDAWRAALNALIAVAPGNSADIAYHLNDARKCTLICRDFSAASQGEAKLIDRLMLLGAGKLVGQQLDAQAPSATEALLREATRANGKCLLTRQTAEARLSAISAIDAARIIRELGLPELRPVGNRLDTSEPNGEHNALGFTHHARLIGDYGQPPELATPIGAEPADMPTLYAAIQACPSLLVPEALQASACCSCAHPGAGHQALRSPPVQLPAEATPLTAHSAVPQAPQSDRS